MSVDSVLAFLAGFSIVLLAVASIANSHKAYHATKQLQSLEQRWESQQEALWGLTKDVRTLERNERERLHREMRELARRADAEVEA